MTYTPQPPEQHPAAPYYTAPAYAPEPPKDLTVHAVLAFASAALVTAFAVSSALISGRAIRHVDEGGLDWSIAVYAVAAVLSLASILAGWVTASLWLHRARKNAEVIAPHAQHARSAGWAWGGWICPIVSLWFPYQVVRDVRLAVTPTAPMKPLPSWWALFVVMQFLDRIVDRLGTDATAEDAGMVQGWSFALAAVAVGALVQWGRVLRAVTREQHAVMYAGAPR